jgi:hypothetical protein
MKVMTGSEIMPFKGEGINLIETMPKFEVPGA